MKNLIKLNADAIRKYNPALADNLLSHNFVKAERQLFPTKATVDVICSTCGDLVSLGGRHNLNYNSKEDVERFLGIFT